MFVNLFFFDLFQIFSFFNSKYFQIISLKFMRFLIHYFPKNNNETNIKKNPATFFGQLIGKPFK